MSRYVSPLEDGIRWAIGPVAWREVIPAIGLKGLHLDPDGTLIGMEWRDLAQFDKYAFPNAPQIGAWLDAMNKRYPAVIGVVARKE